MIQTNRLIIREMTMKDFGELLQILSDPITMKFWPNPFSPEQVEDWIRKNLFNYQQYGFGRWVVELKDEHKIIGDVGFLFSKIDNQTENDLGYIIHAKYWGKGYGIEAASACLNFGFRNLKMKRIVANMPYNHITSIKIAEKLGMEKEKEYYNERNRDILTFLYVKEVN